MCKIVWINEWVSLRKNAFEGLAIRFSQLIINHLLSFIFLSAIHLFSPSSDLTKYHIYTYILFAIIYANICLCLCCRLSVTEMEWIDDSMNDIIKLNYIALILTLIYNVYNAPIPNCSLLPVPSLHNGQLLGMPCWYGTFLHEKSVFEKQFNIHMSCQLSALN
jgi:hypothetical protein